MDALAMQSNGAVLIVDDNPDVRALLARVLRRSGFDVLEACGGGEALALLESQEIAVMLSDVHMPEMSGLELLLETRVRAPRLPFYLMTADLNMTADMAERLGADGFFAKPLLNDALLSVLRQRLRLSV